MRIFYDDNIYVDINFLFPNIILFNRWIDNLIHLIVGKIKKILHKQVLSTMLHNLNIKKKNKKEKINKNNNLHCKNH